MRKMIALLLLVGLVGFGIGCEAEGEVGRDGVDVEVREN